MAGSNVNMLLLIACVSLVASGQARSVLNDGALDLYQLGNVEYTVTAGAGETSEYASKAAAMDLAAVLEEPTLWDGVEGHPNCTVTCNGGNVTSADDNGTKPYSCWGLFKAFCKGHGEKGCGAAGFKCKGHWVGFKGTWGRAAVCEGDSHGFAAKFFKKDSVKVAKFKAGGCLGTSSMVIKNKSSEDSSYGLPWPAQMPQEWDDDFEGAEVLKSMLAESKEPLGQGRCTGFGGGIKAVKVKRSRCDGEDCDQKHADKAASKLERKANDFDSLESTVTKTMEDMGVPMPVHAMPAGLSLDMTPAFANMESRGPRCEILCNDKPAWFKGNFPCLGKLTLKCESGEDSPDWAPNFIAASCKGFWSGIFGRTCKGQATGFVDAEYYDKLNICTGKFGMFAKAKKKEGKFATGKFCKGKSLGAFFVGKGEEEDASIAQAN
ncbi:hypothetical protein COCOBI_08-2640 [Coccomyxa sp. Obi]|nr:hypothetical protein COCOBI_08-2640 [Coccomyxa sp. Obi]